MNTNLDSNHNSNHDSNHNSNHDSIQPKLEQKTKEMIREKQEEQVHKQLEKNVSSWAMFKKSIKNFILRNNFVTLASAFAIGQTMSLFVESLTKNILLPLLYALVNKSKWDQLRFPLKSSYIELGNFLKDLFYVLISIIVIFITIEYVLNRGLAEKKTAKPNTDDLIDVMIKDEMNAELPNDFDRMRPVVNHYQKQERPSINIDRNTIPLNHNLPNYWEANTIR